MNLPLFFGRLVHVSNSYGCSYPSADENGDRFYYTMFYYTDETGKIRKFIGSKCSSYPFDNKIIEEDPAFINGFKRVKYEDGTYSFKKEDGTILRKKFFIASNFNEYGFAMVGDDLGVTWINRDFEVLILDDYEKVRWVPVDITYFKYIDCIGPIYHQRLIRLKNPTGFEAIDGFSNNLRPMSQVYVNGELLYIDSNGNVVCFEEHRRENEKEQEYYVKDTVFEVQYKHPIQDLNKTRFGAAGYAVLENCGIFLSEDGSIGCADAIVNLRPPISPIILAESGTVSLENEHDQDGRGGYTIKPI